MKLKYGFSLLFFLIVFVCKADTNMMFDKANQQFHNKNYDSAAKLYQEMINDGYADAELFYNAGNAYFRTNQIGLSIWCYRKAIDIEPQKDYSDNLRLAYKRIKDPIASSKDIFFIRWWFGLLNLFSTNGWAWIALLSFLLFLTLLTFKKTNHYQAPIWLRALCLSFAILGLAMIGFRTISGLDNPKAIVIQSAKAIKQDIQISEGIEVQIIGQGKSGVKVKLPDGRKVEIISSVLKKL